MTMDLSNPVLASDEYLDGVGSRPLLRRTDVKGRAAVTQAGPDPTAVEEVLA
ncbi:hypothetical protein [Micromonospora sp. NPDC003776]